MKHLTRLERSKELWLVLLLFIIFFFLRLPSLIEPYWYGDEGVYETLAIGINQGKTLYQEIWDNKPPLLYVTYAIFQADQFWVRFASLISGSLAVITFYFLSKLLFKKINSSLIATAIFALFFGLPIIEGNIANAENFMLLPIIIAGYLIYKNVSSKERSLFPLTPKQMLFLAGSLLGIAFLYKIVAIFDLAAFTSFLVISSLPNNMQKKEWKSIFLSILTQKGIVVLGFLLPLILSLLYFITKGALDEYITSIFFSNIGYVGSYNKFLFPQGLLISKVALILLFVLVITWKRTKISTPLLFIVLWTAWSLFNAYFSQRPYTHYLLVVLPSFSLIVGLLATNYLKKLWVITSIVLLLFLANHSFYHWDLKKTSLYYVNFISFVSGNKKVEDYQSFFDRRVPHDMNVVNYLKKHLTENDNVFLWSNNPQVYALLDRTPPGRYTVAYHVLNSKENLKETEEALKKENPKYIVIYPGLQSIPFPMYNYTHTITLNNTEIYERNN